MKIVRFNKDKTIEIARSHFEKGIISIDDDQGYEAREDSIVEFKQDSFFGLLSNESITMGFATRMLDPAPLRIDEEGNYFGNDFDFKSLVYHENESFRNAAAQAEKTKAKTKETALKILSYGIIFELIIIAFLVLVKVLPDYLKNL